VQPETLATHGHEIFAYEIGTASHPASASGKKFRAVLSRQPYTVNVQLPSSTPARES